MPVWLSIRPPLEDELLEEELDDELDEELLEEDEELDEEELPDDELELDDELDVPPEELLELLDVLPVEPPLLPPPPPPPQAASKPVAINSIATPSFFELNIFQTLPDAYDFGYVALDSRAGRASVGLDYSGFEITFVDLTCYVCYRKHVFANVFRMECEFVSARLMVLSGFCLVTCAG